MPARNTPVIGFMLITLLILPGHSAPALAQHNGDWDTLVLCEGMGDAVGLVREGRESGIDDNENQGVDMINRISAHAQTDLMPAINGFIDSSRQLPAVWAAPLFTHACLFNYLYDFATVERISRLIAYRCKLKEPDMKCIQEVFISLPQQQVI
ncbi:hypothetical protein DXV75_05460 [Alteromonas aestuariivivens]|uniref:Uncharacterized protein n=1 Tax=Alteromonas aestuariivivens TaxID=1938339 RepID=A0A3D8MBS7_9ALTE|nr:hypothetical protein [Alteromonas aestuariivivens]RDV27476.1 hypothetical protein DXV75_05460 [Alteromonas aestuariivivens]